MVKCCESLFNKKDKKVFATFFKDSQSGGKQGGLNKKKIQLNLCKMFSIFDI